MTPSGTATKEAVSRPVLDDLDLPAGNSMVLFSGGSKVSDEDLMDKARTVMENGATGLICGRNMWQRPFDEALEMTARIKELLQQFPA